MHWRKYGIQFNHNWDAEAFSPKDGYVILSVSGASLPARQFLLMTLRFNIAGVSVEHHIQTVRAPCKLADEPN
ncbi:hypothetical protein [Serratia oryzae]|uniref:Uncharacterized protein n=1 Tax=Serratia oryzae TaxID=2034155 RepID=A0A1S8CPA4_9GAMM|nr:hypothetical protein [Serratia oryzae]OMQ26932.1 hypothetical protein BMI79_00970 [Serratia oryzae]